MKKNFVIPSNEAENLKKRLSKNGFKVDYFTNRNDAHFESNVDLTTLLKIYGELNFELGLKRRK